jgi:hypothetical protein
MAIDTLEIPGSPTYMQLGWNQRGCAAPSWYCWYRGLNDQSQESSNYYNDQETW